MKWGNSVYSDSLSVFSGGVSLIALPIIIRVFEGQGVHIIITVGLGQNAGGGDRLVFGVAFDDTSIRKLATGVGQSLANNVGVETITVDNQCLGTHVQLVDSPVHGQETGMKNVDFIDFIGRIGRAHV